MPRIKPPRSKPAHEDVPVELRDPEPPPVGDIEIELSDDEPGDVEISLATPPPSEPPAPAAPPAPPPPSDDALQRAIDAQKRAEELQRDAIRQRDEALRRAQERDFELERERSDREDAEYNSVLTAIAAEQAALDKAEADCANAAAAGDWASHAKAQRIIGVASARLDRLEDNKRTFDSRREVQRTQPAPQRQPTPQQPAGFEQRIAALPAQAQAWLRNHPEFINDTAKNRQIGGVHTYLTETKGLTAFSDAYFDALDNEFGFKAPPAPQQHQPAPQPQRRSMPMTAPVTRDVPTPSGQRQSSKMTLTEEERQIARASIVDRPDMPPMTDAQKEYLYAKKKQQYQTMKANGTYSEQRK